MGVLACDRSDCDHIMCDLLIEGEGGMEYYCCYSCFKELEEAKAAWPEGTTVGDIPRLISEFFRSPKNSQFPATDQMSLDEAFNKFVRRRE